VGAAQVKGLTPFSGRPVRRPLTPYLGGDAAKDYPNLAAIPTYAWKNSGCARNGKLYMLPIERYYPGSMLLEETRPSTTESSGKTTCPKNADDFKTRPLAAHQNRRRTSGGSARYINQSYYIYFFAAMFRRAKITGPSMPAAS